MFETAGNNPPVTNATHRLPLLVPLAQRVRMVHMSGGDVMAAAVSEASAGNGEEYCDDVDA